jgi:hypothetical protein
MGSEASVVFAGDNRVPAIAARMGDGITSLGIVADLKEVYAARASSLLHCASAPGFR